MVPVRSPEREYFDLSSQAEKDDVPSGQEDTPRVRRDVRPLLMLRPYLTRHKVQLALAGLALLIAAAATLAIPMAIRRMIDFGFSASSDEFISRYFGMLVIIGAVLAVASAARFYFVNWLGERVVADLRQDVFKHLATLGPGFFDRTHSGEVMSRLTADTTQIKSAAATALSQALRDTIMITGAVVMMFVTSVTLTLLVLAAIPLVLLPLIVYGRTVRRLSRTAQDSLAQASAYAAENLGAVRTMQAFGSETSIANRFAGAVNEAFEAARSRMLARAGLTALSIFLVVTSIVSVLWFGAAMVIDGTLTGGRLGQFVLYAVFAGGSLGQLSEVWGEVQQAAGAAERLGELLEAKPVVEEPVDPLPLPLPGEGRVTFEGVWFSYPSRPDTQALEDASFEIAPGEMVAFVGPSGAGKSTIFNLLLRFYDPDKGTVRVDGVDVSKVRISDLRSRMALVPQDISIFADTVSENIRYGAEDVSQAAIEAAAKIANADGFILALENGYETQLGERGVMLSGGQRQRLAIARAMLRDPRILLLDEATSALDAESEHAVRTALEQAMAGRTTFVITHRLATAQKADRIIVIDQGRIVEHGTHAELAVNGGLYRRLSDLQLTAAE
jgi:ATP-binding cassette, subfamily B, bacterial